MLRQVVHWGCALVDHLTGKQQVIVLEELRYELSGYVNRFNTREVHSSLRRETPVKYQMNNFKKLSEKGCHSPFISGVVSQQFT